jgi:hypothetical protein
MPIFLLWAIESLLLGMPAGPENTYIRWAALR